MNINDVARQMIVEELSTHELSESYELKSRFSTIMITGPLSATTIISIEFLGTFANIYDFTNGLDIHMIEYNNPNFSKLIIGFIHKAIDQKTYETII